MKTEIMLRKQAVALHLQGLNKSEIARKVQRSRSASKHVPWAYPERIKKMVTQIRVERTPAFCSFSVCTGPISCISTSFAIWALLGDNLV